MTDFVWITDGMLYVRADAIVAFRAGKEGGIDLETAAGPGHLDLPMAVFRRLLNAINVIGPGGVK